MKRSRLGNFLGSATARLALTYLAIIMILSIGFSIVIYRTSSQQLGRQLPPSSLFVNAAQDQQPQASTGVGVVSDDGIVQPNDQQNGPQPRVNEFLRERIDEGRSALMNRLVILNIVALLAGAAISYLLARRSLRPIEQAMEAQTQFVSDASHELRTPLTAMQTSNEVFLRRPKATVKDAKALIVQNNDDIARLRSLSDALLSLAQHKRLKLSRRPTQIQDVVSTALTQVVPQATERHISVEDLTKPLRVSADHDLLSQAIVILLDNAIKYSDADSKVTIASRQRGKSVYIDIKDDGIGIRASDLPHLFRRFYRADNARTGGARSGYGLGLAIAKQIAEAHHGDIEVISTVGEGSMFSFKLPSA